MTTALAPIAVSSDRLNEALIKAVGWDRVPAEQRELALSICQRYGLDPMLRHVVMIEGKPYITRDGLLHVAHKSGVFDGIEVEDPTLIDTHWHCRATVYRKDMSRGFAYPGRYPKAGKNQVFAPEMAIKVSEVMALRRAFDVAAPVLEERWDMEEVAAPEARQPVPLAARVASRRADIEARAVAAVSVAPDPDTGEIMDAVMPVDEPPMPPEPPMPATVLVSPYDLCASVSPYDHEQTCVRERGHSQKLMCRDQNGQATWPRPA